MPLSKNNINSACHATARDAQNVAVIASSSGRVWHWHATSGQCLGAKNGAPIVEENDNQIYALDVRGDGASFATAVGGDAG